MCGKLTGSSSGWGMSLGSSKRQTAKATQPESVLRQQTAKAGNEREQRRQTQNQRTSEEDHGLFLSAFPSCSSSSSELSTSRMSDGKPTVSMR